ncbi:leucine-rich repeat-containing protein 19 [Astyanax mexicanus]|uniref:leucine-rich repeat-containing protein 19 n=1 Tax=Astyanax mexicanus TaxID=7994 RepID=UPI0020CADE70|nr:leucine-rich repeat-containing protein 19 [Astyanax mexicanus]
MEMNLIVLLWMATALATATVPSPTDVLDESNKTLTGIPLTYSSSITKLILHHNSITMNSSDTKSLSKLTNLKELDLSYNHIEVLADGAFSGLEKLEVLNLSGNRLKTVKKEALTGLNHLKKLDLQENPWQCDCLFLQWMNESGVQIEGGTCAFPIKRRVLDLISECSTTAQPSSVTSSTTTTTPSPTTAPLPPPPPPPPPPPTATTTTAKATRSTTTPTTTTTTIPTTTSTTTTATTTGATSAAPASTAVTTAQWTSHLLSPNLRKTNISNKDSLTDTDKTGKQEPGVSNTWKFLAGVIVIALCTSMFIVCAVKSPSWYKMLFNYRHQRLREVEEPNIFSTGRYSNFSLDTEQTETSAYELDQGPEQPLEDEDGFIEDRYIQPEDYKEHTEDYKDHSDADEV